MKIVSNSAPTVPDALLFTVCSFHHLQSSDVFTFYLFVRFRCVAILFPKRFQVQSLPVWMLTQSGKPKPLLTSFTLERSLSCWYVKFSISECVIYFSSVYWEMPRSENMAGWWQPFICCLNEWLGLLGQGATVSQPWYFDSTSWAKN